MRRPTRVPVLVLLTCLPSLAACRHDVEQPDSPATAEPEQAEPAPTLPQTITFAPEFSGPPLRTDALSADVTLDTFAEGTGAEAVRGKRISFHFNGYDAATGEQVMGSKEWPVKLVVGATPTDPLAVIMQEALEGLRAGARVRVHVPAVLANAGRPEREPKLGDLWITLTVTDVDEPRHPHGLEAFEGSPVASEQRRDGLEIYDYAAGEGLAASDGDRVEFHYVVTSSAGETLLSTHTDATPVELTVGANTGVPGLAKGLRGARAGTLRKLVVPAELGFDEHAPESFPREVATVMYVEVTRVDPGPDREP